MKKTLIALAVLAASGASFAQATITGNFTYGFAAITTGGATTTDAAGLGVDTSEVFFGTSEDLGGGYKAALSMGLAGADRSGESGNGSVNGRNASLNITTPVGVVTLATSRAADYLNGGLAGVGAYYQGFDGKVQGARSNRDIASFTIPMGAFSLAATYQESANLLGLGAGTTGAPAATGQSLTGLVGGYASGALAANLTYLQFASPIGGNRNQVRLSGNYDFGVAKVGAGAVVTNQDNPAAGAPQPRVTDTLVAATVPFGKTSFGITWTQRRLDDQIAAGTSGQINGTAFQVAHALSKRTAVIGNWARWDAGINQPNGSTMYLLAVSHSF
jgi:hypothetical protein